MLDTPPSTLMGFLRKRLAEISGLALLGVGIALAAALASFKHSDATSTTVTSIGTGQYANLLGALGAETANIIIQSIGVIAGLCLALLIVIWGVRMFRHRMPRRIRPRLVAVPFALIMISFLAAFDGGRHGGALGALMNMPLAGEWLADGPDIPVDWPLVVQRAADFITWGGIALAAIIIVTIPLYIYAAAISAAEFRLVGMLFTGIRKVFGLLVSGVAALVGGITAMARKIPARKAAGATAKPIARARPKPKQRQRREPLVVSSGEPADSPYDDDVSPAARAGRKTSTTGSASGGYHLPPRDLLSPPTDAAIEADPETLDANSRQLESVLAEFGVRGEITAARFGPVVTRYELVPAPGIKSSRVIALADDIARSMAALSVRIAVVPGQNVIGIELPNTDRETVLMRDILDSKSWGADSADLPLALGMDIAGHPVTTDLARMPHLLVAGTTGSGKSVGINSMILSLLYTHTPETCRFIMVDPKMLELSVYDGIPHLLTPVVTESGKAVTALKWAVREMETRYRNMSRLGVRNIEGYNKKLAEARGKGATLARKVQTGFDPETGQPVFEEQDLDLTPLPFIVVVIDEVADLMLVAGKDVEAAVQRLAQMARAAGIHVVMATQRPSVDVITGTIKANFPTRISFQVTSKIDSRTILGEQGGEQLLGKGDMLFMEGGGRVMRVHGPFVDDAEVQAVTNFLREQGEPVYDDNVTTEVENGDAGSDAMSGMGNGGGNGSETGDDASLYNQAVELVKRERKASTSFIQRHLRIGYNRAATIIEEMERNGVVSPANHAGKREILIDEN